MIIELTPGRLGEVRELRLALRDHHAALPEPPGFAVRDAEAMWTDWRKAALMAVTFGDAAVFVSGEDEFGPWDGFAYVELLPPGPRPMLEPTGRHGELKVLVVADDARGQGIGAALTDAAAAWLAGKGAVAMQVSVRATNEGALRFYRDRGAVEGFVTLLEPISPPLQAADAADTSS